MNIDRLLRFFTPNQLLILQLLYPDRKIQVGENYIDDITDDFKGLLNTGYVVFDEKSNIVISHRGKNFVSEVTEL